MATKKKAPARTPADTPDLYVVLADWAGNYTRGDVVAAADLPGTPEELLADHTIRRAYNREEDAWRDGVTRAELEPSESDADEAAANAQLEKRIDAARAANPQRDMWRGTVGPHEAPSVPVGGGNAGTSPGTAATHARPAAASGGGVTNGTV